VSLPRKVGRWARRTYLSRHLGDARRLIPIVLHLLVPASPLAPEQPRQLSVGRFSRNTKIRVNRLSTLCLHDGRNSICEVGSYISCRRDPEIKLPSVELTLRSSVLSSLPHVISPSRGLEGEGDLAVAHYSGLSCKCHHRTDWCNNNVLRTFIREVESLPGNFRGSTSIRSRPLPSRSFPIQNSSVIPAFDAIVLILKAFFSNAQRERNGGVECLCLLVLYVSQCYRFYILRLIFGFVMKLES
jgi:hypothetical protein